MSNGSQKNTGEKSPDTVSLSNLLCCAVADMRKAQDLIDSEYHRDLLKAAISEVVYIASCTKAT